MGLEIRANQRTHASEEETDAKEKAGVAIETSSARTGTSHCERREERDRDWTEIRCHAQL